MIAIQNVETISEFKQAAGILNMQPNSPIVFKAFYHDDMVIDSMSYQNGELVVILKDRPNGE